MNRRARRAAAKKQGFQVLDLDLPSEIIAFDLAELHNFNRQIVTDGFTGSDPVMQFLVDTFAGWKAVAPMELEPGGAVVLQEVLIGLFKRIGVKRYAFSVEAWVSDDLNIRPSLNPNRREVLFVGASDTEGGKKLGHYEIERSVDGNGKLGPWHDAQTCDLRWCQLLDASVPGAATMRNVFGDAARLN